MMNAKDKENRNSLNGKKWKKEPKEKLQGHIDHTSVVLSSYS